jgi:hypothetical protein
MSTPAGPAVNPNEDPWALPPPSISWNVEPPLTIEGTVLSQEMAQRLSIKDKTPEHWDDGRPKKKVIITLQCKPDETDTEDDGRRQLHVNIPSALHTSIREAIKEAGQRTLLVGNGLAVTYTHDEAPAAKGLSGTKQYESLVSPTSDSTQSEPPF